MCHSDTRSQPQAQWPSMSMKMLGTTSVILQQDLCHHEGVAQERSRAYIQSQQECTPPVSSTRTTTCANPMPIGLPMLLRAGNPHACQNPTTCGSIEAQVFRLCSDLEIKINKSLIMMPRCNETCSESVRCATSRCASEKELDVPPTKPETFTKYANRDF